MPSPIIRDEASVVSRLQEYVGLSKTEAETYVRALKEGSLGEGDLRPLLARGMVIQSASNEKVYFPVHPRLALSNLYRSRTDKSSERRKLVDKLTAELIPAYESGRRGR